MPKQDNVAVSSSPVSLSETRPHKSEDDDKWVEEFEIPKMFSARSMDCLSTGILTQSCRTEVVQTLATNMWVHTHYPSKYAYNTICSRLVKVHPTLADDAGDDQVAHVSICDYLLW